MHKILLVEDDFALAMGTEYALQAEGYEVVHASNLEQATILLNQDFDLVLLDVMLPDGTGYDFCREIRKKNVTVPIIFLTAVAEEANVVQGLELGADDYIAKPYRVKELLSRIAANIRRFEFLKNKNQTNRYVFGSHEFLLEEFRLQCNQVNVECAPSEMRLLRELILHEGQVLTRNQLLERLYDAEENYIDDNTLSVYMKRLRDHLSVDADWIETVRGVGYRFRKR